MKRPLYFVVSFMVAIAHCFPDASRRQDAINDYGKDEPVYVLPDGNTFSLFPSMFSLPDFLSSGVSSSDESSESNIPMEVTEYAAIDNFVNSFLKRLRNALNRFEAQPGMPSISVEGTNAILDGKLPDGGNTTSTVKVYANHIITINETTYQKDNGDFNVIARVKTYDVRPVNGTSDAGNDTETDLGGGEEVDTSPQSTRPTVAPNKNDPEGESTTQEPRSVETVEDSAGNEIPNKEQTDNLDA